MKTLRVKNGVVDVPGEYKAIGLHSSKLDDFLSKNAGLVHSVVMTSRRAGKSRVGNHVSRGTYIYYPEMGVVREKGTGFTQGGVSHLDYTPVAVVMKHDMDEAMGLVSTCGVAV